MGEEEHCPAGHEYSPENTVLENMERGGKGRRCKKCKIEHIRLWQVKHPKKLSVQGNFQAAQSRQTSRLRTGWQYESRITVSRPEPDGKYGQWMERWSLITKAAQGCPHYAWMRGTLCYLVFSLPPETPEP